MHLYICMAVPKGNIHMENLLDLKTRQVETLKDTVWLV